MKKGCLITVLIIVIAGVGIVLRTCNWSKLTKNKNDWQTERVKNIYGRPLIEKGVIRPPGEWRSILPGKWNLLSIESFENYFLVLKADIDFKENKNFKLFVRAWNYENEINTDQYNNDPDSLRPTAFESEARMKAGGGMTGTWEFISDSAFQLLSDECEIEVNNGNIEFEGCEYLDKRIFGTAIETGWKSEIKAFSQDTILINGQDFRKNSTLYYYFTRLK